MNPNEPKVTASDNQRPPKWLSLRARRVWRWLSPQPIAMRVLTDADRDDFGLGCEAFADFLSCRDVLISLGSSYTTTTPQGDTMVRPRPEAAQMAEAWRRADHILSKFGMDPSSRSRIKVEAETEIDPMEEFLNRGQPG